MSEAVAVTTSHSKIGDLLVLAKVRLNALVVLTAAGGYYMSAAGDVAFGPLLLTCLGTALVAGGASALNQVDERDTDRLMLRTRLRPVADGRMGAAQGRAIASALAVAGLAILWYGANALAATVALATLLSYTVVYTPLKRRTSLATIVGAVPGALPPVIGWAASAGSLASLAPWSLFLLMFVWQLPHFLAIAWLYREDYARAGLPMLSVVDRDGGVAGRQALLWAATLVPVSLLPAALHLTGGAFAIGALLLGVTLLVLTFRFAFRRTNDNARTLFYASITYLPLLWMLMVIDRQ